MTQTRAAPARVLVELRADPLSVDAAYRAVCDERCGGTALFVGTTRSPSEGRSVEALEYEAWDEVARAELERLAAAAVARHGLGGVYLGHRVGIVPAGEPSVIVATSAAHRAQALTACRELIDDLKRDVPIWKKEHRDDGAVWVGLPSEDTGEG